MAAKGMNKYNLRKRKRKKDPKRVARGNKARAKQTRGVRKAAKARARKRK